MGLFILNEGDFAARAGPGRSDQSVMSTKPITTREAQYQHCLEVSQQAGVSRLGLMTNQAWYDDPKRLTFTLARYKFVAKMLSGLDRVLDVGWADAFGTRIVVQEVRRLLAVDFDPIFVADVLERMEEKWKFDCQTHDMLAGPVPGKFSGAYALDVLEHIPVQDEDRFLSNLAASLGEHGVLILGSPSLQSQVYASPLSKQGHVNCKDQPGLKALMGKYFHNVFTFSMNDEVVHTGYYPMAQYLFALGCSKR